MKTLDERAGDLVTEKVLEYMRQHPDPNLPYYEAFKQVYKRLMRNAEDSEAERVEEFDDRVRSYQSELNLSRERAADRVLEHDPKLARELNSPLLQNLLVLVECAVSKGEDFMSAAMDILRNDPNLTKEVAGAWLLDQAERISVHALGPHRTQAADFQTRFKEVVGRFPAVGDGYLSGNANEEMIR